MDFIHIEDKWTFKLCRKMLFFQDCPQFSKKMSASKSCMLTNFGMFSGSLQYICHGCQSEQMHPTSQG